MLMTPQSLSCRRLYAHLGRQANVLWHSCERDREFCVLMQEPPNRRKPLRRNFTLLSDQLVQSQALVRSSCLLYL